MQDETQKEGAGITDTYTVKVLSNPSKYYILSIQT